MSEETPIGTRVRVMDVDGNDLGYGTYKGDEAIDFDDMDEIELELQEYLDEADYGIDKVSISDDLNSSITSSKILLDSGQTVFGFECNWTEVDENSDIEIAMLEKAGKKAH